MKKVTIEFNDDRTDSLGRRSLTVVWTTTEMVELSKTGCECSGCIDYRTGQKRPPAQIIKCHPPARGQCFFTEPQAHIESWKNKGFTVTVKPDPYKKGKP